MPQEADVLIRLEQEIRSEADRIVREGENKARAIRKEADAEASRLLEEARAKATARVNQLRTRRSTHATLQKRQQIGRVKADAVNEAIKIAGAQLTGDHSKPHYKKALERFLSEALEASKPSKGPFRILARREDEATVKEWAKSKSINASVDASGEFSGGIEIVDEAAHTRVVNTFESRLRKGFEAVSEQVRKVLGV